MSAVASAIPPKPKTPAMIATTKNVKAKRNIIFSPFLVKLRIVSQLQDKESALKGGYYVKNV